MTLDALKVHVCLIQDLRTAKEMLQALQASALRASTVDGMPHATGAGDPTSALALKIGEQRDIVRRLEQTVKASEPDVKSFIDSIEDNRTNLIFYLRFICAYSWAEVAEIIGGRNTEAAVKSQAYRYLKSTAP